MQYVVLALVAKASLTGAVLKWSMKDPDVV
jgi:hypothetical protein